MPISRGFRNGSRNGSPTDWGLTGCIQQPMMRNRRSNQPRRLQAPAPAEAGHGYARVGLPVQQPRMCIKAHEHETNSTDFGSDMVMNTRILQFATAIALLIGAVCTHAEEVDDTPQAEPAASLAPSTEQRFATRLASRI